MRAPFSIIGIGLLLPHLAVGGGPLALFDPIEASSKTKIETSIKAFAASDPVSLHDLFNDWHGPYRSKGGDDLAIDDARFDIGIAHKEWGYIGYTYRHHSITKASADTTLLVWQQLNDIAMTPGKLYDLSIGIELFEGDGIVYAASLPLPESFKKSGVEVGIGFELLRGRNMQDGYLSGKAVANSDRDYDYNAVSDYFYTENYLYSLDIVQAKGYGYTTHLTFRYRSDRLVIRAIANDIYGKIFWKELPYSYVYIRSDNKRYDENGYVVYNPAVSGVEKYVDHTQKLYPRYRLEGSYEVSKSNRLTLGTDSLKRNIFPYLSFEHEFDHSLYSSLSYESRFKSFGLSLYYKGFHAAFRSDSLRHPSALALSLSYALFF